MAGPTINCMGNCMGHRMNDSGGNGSRKGVDTGARSLSGSRSRNRRKFADICA